MIDVVRPPEGRRTAAAVLASGFLIVTVLSGCSTAGEQRTAPTTTAAPPKLVIPEGGPFTVPPTLPLPEGYDAPDTRDADLPTVEGAPNRQIGAPEVAMGGGTSRLSGTATGPDGPVGGATVRIERFVGDQSGRLDVTADAAGHYEATGLPGGRYRLRAFLAPAYTVTRPTVLFQAADHGDLTIDLDLEHRNYTTMTASANTGRWRITQRGTATVAMSHEYVDDDGIVRSGAVSGGEVDIQVSDGVTMVSESSTTTGPGGSVSFTFECATPGYHSVTVNGGGQTRNLSLAECLPPPEPEPTETDIAVGASFTVPVADVIPAGLYVAEGTEASTKKCLVTYEQFVDGQWIAQSAGPTLKTSTPARNIKVSKATEPCTYRRMS